MKNTFNYKNLKSKHLLLNFVLFFVGLLAFSNSILAQTFPTGLLPLSASQYASLPSPNWDTLNKYSNLGAIIPLLTGSGLGSNSVVMLQTPPVGNQGAENSCVGWAVGYAAMGILSYNNYCGWSNAERSPSYVYNQIYVGSCAGVPI